MKSKSTAFRATLFASVLLSTPGLAADQADQASEVERPAELDELVVTAALEPLSAKAVAASVTIITREDIERRQVKYLGDLLRDVPGFSISQAGGLGAQTQLRVRGAEANHMLVLVDGIRANDPASVDEFQFQFALTSSIERIEIIRGPQSSIWGSDAVAGVINIIHRKNTEATWAGGSLEAGSFETLNATAEGGVSRGAMRLQGSVTHAETDGINIARQGDERDGSKNTTANLGMEWDVSDAWQVSASGQHVSAETQFDDVDFFVTGLPVDTDRLTEAERSYLRGEVRYRPVEGRWSGNASLNYSDSDNQNYYDGAWNSSTAAQVLDARLRGSVLLGDVRDDQEHRLGAGLDYIDTEFEQRGIATPWGDPNQDQGYDQSSLAAEYVGRVHGGFTWTLSGRYNDFSDFESIGTWQAAFSQQVSERFRARGSYGTGFKAPTFTERFGFFADQFIGNPSLKPEKSRGWELGFDSQWADSRVTLSAVYFDQTLEDEIDGFVFDPDSFLFTAVNKDSDSRRQGVEIVFDWRAMNDLDIAANYTYTDASETGLDGMNLDELRRPRHMASLNAQYHFARDRANVNLNISYTGKQLDVFFDPVTFASEHVELGSYTVVDLAGAWKLTGELDITARVTNLTDEEYEDLLGYSTRGRAFYAGLRGRFEL
jgi:vitamin B12 transporter